MEEYYVDFEGWVRIKAINEETARDKFNDIFYDLLQHKEFLSKNYEIDCIESVPKFNG